MSYSIRKQTTRRVVLGISGLVAVFCIANYFVIRSVLIHSFDDELLHEFQSVSSVSRVWPDGDFYVDLDFDIATQYGEGGSRYFQAWDSSLTFVIDRSPYIENTDSQWPLPVVALGEAPVFVNMNVDNKSVRAVLRRIPAQWGWVEQQPNLEVADEVKGYSLVLMVARDRSPLSHTLLELALWMSALGLASVGLSWFIVSSLVSRGMKTLGVIADRIENIASTEDFVSPDEQWPEEIKPIAETLNRLLSRIDATVQRMQRFTDDAAHELRTPIAELRLVTDVALRAPDNPERAKEAILQMNEVSYAMANTVNAMLDLARFQSGYHRSRLSSIDVDVASVIQEVISQTAEVAHKRHLQVVYDAPDLFQRRMDLDLTKLIFRNLIGNAIAYASEETVVRIELNKTENGFVLVIQNEVTNLNADDLEHLTEPFWRKGASRHQRDHVGLGLALVKEACQLMNLSLQFTLADTHVLQCKVIQ